MKCKFIYNPNSGKGKFTKKKDYILSRLKTKFEIVDYEETLYAGHASKLALEACGRYDILVISGGDGTVNEIANAICRNEEKPILGYLPSGTCNDFARNLGIPNNLNKALNIILDGNVVNYDVFKADERYGVYVCGTGVFTGASYLTKQNVKKKLGKLAYFTHSAYEVFATKTFEVEVNINEKKINENCVLILLINSTSVAGFSLNKNAKYDDGIFDLVMITEKYGRKKMSIKTLLTVFKMFLFGIGSIIKQKNVIIEKANVCDVHFSNDMNINLDGELGFKRNNFHCELQKGRVRIFGKNRN